MTVNLGNLIDRHRRYYENQEKPKFDRARRYYRGDFWGTKLDDTGDDTTTLSFRCAKNITYAIADSAISSLLGPNPQATAVPRNPSSEEYQAEVDALMEYTFDRARLRRRSATALIDAVLCGRGIFKTGWSESEDRAVIQAVDPSALFFDRTVRDVSEVRYWIEATVVPFDEFRQRIVDGTYTLPDKAEVVPDRYPKWLTHDGTAGDTDGLRDAFEWITVYEYYDAVQMKVMHYVKSANCVVFEDEIEYIPYSMFSLNQNGVDVAGLSEIQLILDQQKSINDMLTHMKQIAYLQIPRIMYMAGMISEEDLNGLVSAQTGSFVPVHVNNAESIRSLGSMFFPSPMPETPQGVIAFTDRQENDAAFISALAEAARGQVAGARTATEMAIIDSQLRTRLATREGHLNDAIEDVARKAFFLTQKYMKEAKQVRLTGKRGWAEVTWDSLQGIEVDFKMVSYNPVKKNPAVMAETIVQMLPFLEQNPHVDDRRLVQELVNGLGFSSGMLRSIEEVEELMQQQAAAEEQALMGGAAGGAPALEAAGMMPPEAGADLPPEAMASPAGPALPPEVEALVAAGVPEEEIIAAMEAP